MIERATPLKTAIVRRKGWRGRSPTPVMRAALGVVMVLAVAAALWYAKTAIFLAFASIARSPA